MTRISRQAEENRAYVRRLLRKRDPAYAAMLDLAIWELSSCGVDDGQRMRPVGSVENRQERSHGCAAGRGSAIEVVRAAGEAIAADRLYILHGPVFPGLMLALITAHRLP